ncbi:MAG: SagB/ThcOx family dehydrogenase [Candidatus Syntrophonatronum acetioxidans]|uniref:SagB/ThcOx family dehydrogenase n=1 Tax=Candidatus Syntrophonatronum acetioxidans TaxID=1795816 RepID=A0A424YB92_9FIRM|nr:MAG: SagB/ThcOx family dehydrogenase [Candidatus Syntrophonatronum acetioxidans]
MISVLVVLVLVHFSSGCLDFSPGVSPDRQNLYAPEGEKEIIELPEPVLQGGMTVERAIAERRSVRSYQEEPLTLQEVSQLLWAAQGITEEARGLRAVPSAGALYPLKVYILVGEEEDLKTGIYKYRPHQNELVKLQGGDLRPSLYEAALSQSPVKEAPVVMVITAKYYITTSHYGERGIRYVHMEAGHAGQNVYLQGVSLGIQGVVIGAFEEEEVRNLLSLSSEEEPLYLIPLGK